MEKDGTYQPTPQIPSEKSRTAAQQPDRLQTLADVREALAECDTLRLDPSLPEPDRRDMDTAALALRNLERELIDGTSETLLDRLEAASKPLEDLARDIRTRVTAMNAPAKVLERIKKVASLVTRVLAEVGRW
ncbi:MAG TPA: hypothetical protein IAB85_02875 [Candidatus Coprenecus merdigallinarum]|nr:hypothetical protein [Candidatus Coprenecus merdigallinarum]